MSDVEIETPAGQEPGSSPASESAPQDVFSEIVEFSESDVGDEGSEFNLGPADEDVEAPVAPAPSPEAAPTPPPAPPVPELAAAEAPPTPSPAAPAESPPAPAQEPTQPAPAATELTPEQRLQARENLVGELSQQYVLSKEEADALITEPNTVLPRLAARLYVDVLERMVPAITQQLMSTLPEVIERRQVARTEAKANEDSFFSKWPELKAHRPVVEKVTRSWREANPTAPLAEAIQAIGVSAWTAAGLPMAQLLAKLSDAPTAPTPPPPPPAPRGYAPAPAAALPPTGTVPSANIFDQFVREFHEEDI